MNKIWGISCVVLLSCATGYLVGVKVATHYAGINEKLLLARPKEDRCDLALRALVNIQSNTNNAIAFLEHHLDLSILELGEMLAGTPHDKWPEVDRILLARAKAYREMHPRTSSNPDQDKQVSAVLSLVNEISIPIEPPDAFTNVFPEKVNPK